MSWKAILNEVKIYFNLLINLNDIQKLKTVLI